MDKFDVTKDGEKWKLTKEGQGRAVKTTTTKKEMLDSGLDYVRKHGGSVKIHKENGRYQEERTFPRSKDPKKTPG